MNREVHVRFWESARVRFPRATQLGPFFHRLHQVGIHPCDLFIQSIYSYRLSNKIIKYLYMQIV
jgi:hypothetical protein